MVADNSFTLKRLENARKALLYLRSPTETTVTKL